MIFPRFHVCYYANLFPLEREKKELHMHIQVYITDFALHGMCNFIRNDAWQ